MIYFDEAGYTGSDLTNSEQPYFALASIRMTDDEVIRMKKDIGYYEWGKELHFIKMYKNFQGRAMLDKIFNHPLMDDNHVLPSFAHKRYCLRIVLLLWLGNHLLNLLQISIGLQTS